MANYEITGGKKLKGVAVTGTAKNSAIAAMCASLLAETPTTLCDVPKIEEVARLQEVLGSIGIKFFWQGRNLKILPPKRLQLQKIDVATAQRTRVVLLLLSVLAHRFSNFTLPAPGGCKLGKRTVAPHIFALEKFGLKIAQGRCDFKVSGGSKLVGTEIVMFESGDTTTENAIMAAVLASGKTTIKMASANYQVQDLCFMLNKMGAKISGIGSTTLQIQGVRKLHGCSYSIIPDPIVSMFWIALAATTKSEIIIKGCPILFLDLELLKLEKMGFKYKILRRYKSRSGCFELVDIKTFASALTALSDKLYARPFPGLNIDNLPFFVPIATQARGETLVHDWVYENRAPYYLEFQKLGADIKLADLHRVFITGPTKLKGAEIVCPPALRPATILVIGMLAAAGKSVLRNTYSIDRGYENLYEQLRTVGAEIKETD